MFNTKVKKETSDRLRRIEGQVRGIQKMLEEERPCEAIITQFMAARAALDQVGIAIITQYVRDCLRTQSDEADEDQSLERALSLFLRLQ